MRASRGLPKFGKIAVHVFEPVFVTTQIDVETCEKARNSTNASVGRSRGLGKN